MAFETTATCPGCKEEINLLEPHLVVTHKVKRLAFVAPAPAAVTPDTEDDEDTGAPILGERSGVGEEVRFHRSECAAAYFDKQPKTVRLKLNKDDSDPYEEGASIMHEAGEEE